MNDAWIQRLLRAAALLAITAMYLTVWGFSGIGKLIAGYPQWFADKFGATLLATVPGLRAGYWILALSEVLGFALALGSLLRGEAFGRRPPVVLNAMLVWSLFVFVQLAFGQWLTAGTPARRSCSPTSAAPLWH